MECAQLIYPRLINIVNVKNTPTNLRCENRLSKYSIPKFKTVKIVIYHVHIYNALLLLE